MLYGSIDPSLFEAYIYMVKLIDRKMIYHERTSIFQNSSVQAYHTHIGGIHDVKCLLFFFNMQK